LAGNGDEAKGEVPGWKGTEAMAKGEEAEVWAEALKAAEDWSPYMVEVLAVVLAEAELLSGSGWLECRRRSRLASAA